MRRAVLAIVAVAAAILIQLTLLDRVHFPGGSGPDLVLLVVVVLALAGGPVPGMLTGFGAGLALDAAPPGSHVLGQSALVFCLVGYGCGKMRAPLERSSWLPLAGVAAGVAGGEVLQALVGMIFSDPDITVASVRQVLPPAVAYDLVLSPFVLYAVVRLGRYGGWVSGPARGSGPLTGQELAGAGLAGAGLAGGLTAAAGAVRDTGSGRGPRLKAAAARRGDGWIGGHQGQPGRPAGEWLERRRQLRIRGGVAGSAAAGQVRAPAPPAAPVHLRFTASRRHDGMVGGTARGPYGVATRPGRSRPARLRAGALRGSGTGHASAPGKTRHIGGSSRLRAKALRGGPSALPSRRGRRSAVPRLRLRGRRGDGLVGGGALASAPGLRMPRVGRGTPGAVFLARRAPGAAGPLRSGGGQGATPRFRSAGRGLLRRGGGLGGSRWAGTGRGALPGGRGGLPGGRGRLGGRGGPGGRRWPRLAARRWHTRRWHTRRWKVWQAASKRRGGLR